MKLPLYSSKIKAGFPSPADDYLESELDINDYLISNPNSTFLVKVSGNSMTGDGIFPGDILAVDKSLEYLENQIIIANLNGEFCVKRYKNKQLISSNPDFSPISIGENDSFIIWGVVVGVIRKLV
jgi:DNA polymerase V